MTKKAIGVFDSGLGGLTAVRELLTVLPYENIIYFGDTSRVPYGNRSHETIKKYSMQDACFLLTKNVKLIIAACGTASSVAPEIGDSISVPFTGVVAPTAAAAVKATKNGKIGVIGTTATIKTGSYKRQIQKLRSDIEVFEKDCPLFVPLVENGFTSPNDQIVSLVIERYLAPLRKTGIDTLILGCTHYPIIAESISKALPGVKLIDSGRETALYAATLLKEQNALAEDNQPGKYEFYVSDTTEGFSSLAGIFLGRDISGSVSHVDIEDIINQEFTVGDAPILRM